MSNRWASVLLQTHCALWIVEGGDKRFVPCAEVDWVQIRPAGRAVIRAALPRAAWLADLADGFTVEILRNECGPQDRYTADPVLVMEDCVIEQARVMSPVTRGDAQAPVDLVLIVTGKTALCY